MHLYTLRTKCSRPSIGKGKNAELLAVLAIHGPWTGETLRVLANVFDYVIPIARVADLANTLEAYLNGDKIKV